MHMDQFLTPSSQIWPQNKIELAIEQSLVM